MSIQSLKARRLMKRWGQGPESVDSKAALAALNEEIEAGLKGEGDVSSKGDVSVGTERVFGLPMIPSLTVHGGVLRFEPSSCIALDIGGTTMKRAKVTADENGRVHLSNGLSADVPGRDKALTEDEFFRRVCRFAGIDETTERLAVSFSHYMRVLPGFDAEIVGWCKELQVTEPSGLTLAEIFRRAAGNPAMDVRVTNDSVASMLGCVGESAAAAGEAQEKADEARKIAGKVRPQNTVLGLVIGTGFNICWPADNGTVYNTEAGDAKAFPQGLIDHAVDAASACPGEACAEKLVSGVYLSEIVERCLEKAEAAGVKTEGQRGLRISDYCASSDRVTACIAHATVERSAKIAAVCCAAFLKRNKSFAAAPKGRILIGTEGSVIGKVPGYKKMFLKWLRACGVNTRRVELIETELAGLKGAARLMGM